MLLWCTQLGFGQWGGAQVLVVFFVCFMSGPPQKVNRTHSQRHNQDYWGAHQPATRSGAINRSNSSTMTVRAENAISPPSAVQNSGDSILWQGNAARMQVSKMMTHVLRMFLPNICISFKIPLNWPCFFINVKGFNTCFTVWFRGMIKTTAGAWSCAISGS